MLSLANREQLNKSQESEARTARRTLVFCFSESGAEEEIKKLNEQKSIPAKANRKPFHEQRDWTVKDQTDRSL